MDIQVAIQEAKAILRKAEGKIIEKKSELNKWDIVEDIWTVRNIMDAIHHELHQGNNDTIKSN